MSAVANAIRSAYLTTQEAAEIIGVHPSQMTRYAQQYGLQLERVGRQMLFLRREIQRFKRPGQGCRRDLVNSQKS